ncbi:unnamed protein product, partial [Meganyctiphanes norvegica]
MSTLTECDDNSKLEEINGTCIQKRIPPEETCDIEGESQDPGSVVENGSATGKSLSEGDSTLIASVIEEQSGNMLKNYFFSLFGIVLVLFFAHPMWINLLVSSEGVAAQMTYAQNFYLWT